MPGKPKKGGADSNPHNTYSKSSGMDFDHIKQIQVPDPNDPQSEDPSTGEATSSGQMISKFVPEHGYFGRLIRGQQGSQDAASYMNMQSMINRNREQIALDKMKQGTDYAMDKQSNADQLKTQSEIDKEDRDDLDAGLAWGSYNKINMTNTPVSEIRAHGKALKRINNILAMKYGGQEKEADIAGKVGANNKQDMANNEFASTMDNRITKENAQNQLEGARASGQYDQLPQELGSRSADFGAKTAKDQLAQGIDQASISKLPQIAAAEIAKKSMYPTGMYAKGALPPEGLNDLSAGRSISTITHPIPGHPEFDKTVTTQQPAGVYPIATPTPVTPDQHQRMFGQPVLPPNTSMPSKPGMAGFGQTPPPRTVPIGPDSTQNGDIFKRVLQATDMPAYSTDIINERIKENARLKALQDEKQDPELSINPEVRQVSPYRSY
jgi:hypothetical protein